MIRKNRVVLLGFDPAMVQRARAAAASLDGAVIALEATQGWSTTLDAAGRTTLVLLDGSRPAPQLGRLIDEARRCGEEIPVVIMLEKVVAETVAAAKGAGVRRVLMRDELEAEMAGILRAAL